MGENLFTVLFSTIKSKAAGIVSKLKLWLSWNYIRSRGIAKIRDFFFRMLDIRPKHKNDYYTVFGWMISKRLAYAILMIVGVLSIWYISANTKVFSRFTSNGGIRTYDYDSVMLRMAKNQVRIKAKSGYVAYVGEVEKGYVTGAGNLYSPDGVLLYTGNFLKNQYEGDGSQYYTDGTLHYIGTFHENLYEGVGKLYREDGTEEYDGQFWRGMKEGAGQLYDAGGNEIFQGNFSADQIVYSDMLGKSAEEIREMYKGKQILYEGADPTVGNPSVLMPGIGAIYEAVSDGGAADDTAKAAAVYVLSDTFRSGTTTAEDISDLHDMFGEPIYEGNSVITLPEAVAVNVLNSNKHALNGKVSMESTENFSDDIIVDSIDGNYSVYIYSYRRGDLIYSFVCKGKGGRFEFYSIMEENDNEESA